MKKFTEAAKDYVRKCTDDEINYLSMKLSQRIGTDVAEVIEIVQKNYDMDKWLILAESADEFFDMVDILGNCLQVEIRKRFGHEQTTQRQQVKA